MSFIFQKLFTGSILSYDSGKQFPLKTDPERKESFMSKMVVSLNENSYPIYIEHHLLSHLSEYSIQIGAMSLLPMTVFPESGLILYLPRFLMEKSCALRKEKLPKALIPSLL